MAKKLPMLTENNSPLIPFNSAALIQCLRASVVHVDPTTPIPGNQFRVSGAAASVDRGPNVELSPTTSLSEESAGVHPSVLFVRRFRRGRGNEFFKARIIPERIEHWIKPEQRRSVFVTAHSAR